MTRDKIRSLFHVGDRWRFCGKVCGEETIVSVGPSGIAIRDEVGHVRIEPWSGIEQAYREIGIEIEEGSTS